MWRAATVGATTIVARPTIELQEEGSQCSTHIVYGVEVVLSDGGAVLNGGMSTLESIGSMMPAKPVQCSGEQAE